MLARIEFKPSSVGYKTFQGALYTFGLSESGHGENDPDFYTLLQNNAREGLPENQFDRDVWAALSESEGSLRAINTWDTAFLSAGPFQHTAGRGDGKGELPGVLDTVRSNAPEAYWRHFGRFGLQPVDTEISGGAKYGYFELRGETLDAPEKKNTLRRFKWAHRFREALKDDQISEWVLTEGFRRLDRIRDRTLTLVVEDPSREEPITFDARIGDLFRRDLMQALLLDWHINYPAEVWKQELGEWYFEEGEQKYDPGNQWRNHLQDHLQTWAGEWSQTLTEALPLEEDDDGNRMLNGPLDLSDTEARELTLSLLGGRMEGQMTDPDGRTGKILRYTQPDLLERIAGEEGYILGEYESQEELISDFLVTELSPRTQTFWDREDPDEVLNFSRPNQ